MDTTDEDADDRVLLERVATGHGGAFESLYTRYDRRVYRYLLTLMSDTHAAEDVLVETMTAVWRNAAKYRGASRVSTWIFGIARHKALDARRSTARAGRNEPLDDALDLPSDDARPDELTHRDLEAAEVKQALEGLSPEHREVLQLAFFEDLAYEDIAALLGIPENTVKTRVYYAKRQLKARLS